ncbi:MAG TPA: flagellar basal body P-ring formation chaperone FlgA [Paraburkholderia sp.]|jgi:flagella basal body P-ring formation protein FlgA
MALSAFAVLPGLRRAARLQGARRRAWSAFIAASCAGLALATAGALPLAAYGQQGGGPIVIPGPGEKNPADAQALAARIGMATSGAAPTAAALAALRPTRAPQNAADSDSDTIVIPGTGEPAGQAAAAAYATSGALTAPGAGSQASLQRMNPQAAARRVAPVFVSNAQARYSVPATNTEADAAAASAPVEIDPLAARGEPPQLGGPGGTAAVRTRVPAAPAVAPVQVVQATSAAPAVQAVQAAQIAQTGQMMRVAQRGAAALPAAAGASTLAASTAVPAGQQDGESIRAAALAFLQQQTAGLPGKITITVSPAFGRGLTACTALEPFLPPGARLWGHTSVGVRCSGARPWTLYMQARISLQATYYTAARQIAPGETLSAADLVAHEGDLATLPQAVITDPSQAVGAISLVRIGAGLPLRQDTLKSASSVTIGQTVRVVAMGDGFTISSEGSVMNNATPGQQVRVKTANGQIITGIVKDASTVQIQL